ncbi:MAG TPA: succinate dehydrogenase, hydrophobic membrane anchor protein [Verrucomicrobiae bacterium]|nr:succinate dehydrogenase, hydrophobic membrane anchor protein [Verrucomicrobiae bacterium]
MPAEEATLRSPLKRARGYGSAKEGVQHFWVQRVSAVALVPLSLWFVFSVAQLSSENFPAVKHWASAPSVAVMLALLVVTLFYHSMLGIQVVVEDYVASEGRKLVTLLLLKFAHAVGAAAGIFAILKIALGN